MSQEDWMYETSRIRSDYSKGLAPIQSGGLESLVSPRGPSLGSPRVASQLCRLARGEQKIESPRIRDYLRMVKSEGCNGSAAKQLRDFLRIRAEAEGSAIQSLGDLVRITPGEEHTDGAAALVPTPRVSEWSSTDVSEVEPETQKADWLEEAAKASTAQEYPLQAEMPEDPEQTAEEALEDETGTAASAMDKIELLLPAKSSPAVLEQTAKEALEAETGAAASALVQDEPPLPAKPSPRPSQRAGTNSHSRGKAVQPSREATVPPRPWPSMSIGNDFMGLGGLAAASCVGAQCGMFVGAPVAAVAGLLLGAASCAAGGAFFAPVTFGFSAPLAAGLCAEAGLWLGAACGTVAGAAIGSMLGIALQCVGCRLDLGWSNMRLAAVTILLSALLGPCLAAVGAWFGLFSGCLLGLFAGLCCVLFTAGLSVPFGIVVGAVVGSAVAAAIGALSGACISVLIAVYREQLIAYLRPLFLQIYAGAKHCWDWLAQIFVKDEERKEDDCKRMKLDEGQSCANSHEKLVGGQSSRGRRRKGGKSKVHEKSRAYRA